MFSLFDLVSSFQQITSHKNVVPLTAVCTPMGLKERLVMPQDSSASTGWFVNVINEVIKALEQAATYLNYVIVFNSDPTAHVKMIRELFERLRKKNVKFCTSKARLGTTDDEFLDQSISPAGVHPKTEKVSTSIKIPMPQDGNQVRTLLSGAWFYRKFLRGLSKRVHPITSVSKEGVHFDFTPAMKAIVRACYGCLLYTSPSPRD